MVKLDLKDLAASSLKLEIFEAEDLLDLVFSRLIIRALRPHSLKFINSDSSLLLDELNGDCSIAGLIKRIFV